jgi:hypothetical protein
VFDSYGEDVVSKYHLNMQVNCNLQVNSLFSTRYPNLNDSIVIEFYGNIKRYPGTVKRLVRVQ